jgi:hypothetical protein
VYFVALALTNFVTSRARETDPSAPPAYVRPYVKRHKNHVIDAGAVCETVIRASMQFVATKTPEQQSCLTLHRTRHLFIRRQTSDAWPTAASST